MCEGVATRSDSQQGIPSQGFQEGQSGHLPELASVSKHLAEISHIHHTANVYSQLELTVLASPSIVQTCRVLAT